MLCHFEPLLALKWIFVQLRVTILRLRFLVFLLIRKRFYFFIVLSPVLPLSFELIFFIVSFITQRFWKITNLLFDACFVQILVVNELAKCTLLRFWPLENGGGEFAVSNFISFALLLLLFKFFPFPLSSLFIICH